MSSSSEKKARLHRTTAFAIFAVYLAVATSVDLFHTEDCVFGALHSGATNSVSSNDSCPACAFLAGHNSTGVSHAPALLGVERLFAPQSLPPLAVIRCNEWAYSIAPRAPPSIIIS